MLINVNKVRDGERLSGPSSSLGWRSVCINTSTTERSRNLNALEAS